MPYAVPYRCPTCGSVFALGHRCHGPIVDMCVCGHPERSHHATAKNVLYCTVASPEPCPCKRYQGA